MCFAQVCLKTWTKKLEVDLPLHFLTEPFEEVLKIHLKANLRNCLFLSETSIWRYHSLMVTMEFDLWKVCDSFKGSHCWLCNTIIWAEHSIQFIWRTPYSSCSSTEAVQYQCLQVVKIKKKCQDLFSLFSVSKVRIIHSKSLKMK